jgi:hypothetical protein
MVLDPNICAEPYEARLWPLARVKASHINPGDYLIRLGNYERIYYVLPGVEIKTERTLYVSDEDVYRWVLRKPLQSS